jgi:hypothetical protein
MRKFSKASMTLAASALLIGFSAAAPAQTWQETLPPQAIVNASLASQDGRMDSKVEDGARLHPQDNRIVQEREMASRSDSRIGNMEDRALNRPENAISPQLRHE